MSNSESWEKIFRDNNILSHNFKASPFILTAEQIKRSCQDFTRTTEKEVRILCKQDTRESRPKVFIDNNLFILPINNGVYTIIQGEGYIDIPPIKNETEVYRSKLGFIPDTSQIGDSEMQHIDYAYATSLIRTFMDDPTLVLTIRGRKYTPEFSFYAGSHMIRAVSVQTEVDAGYEGENSIVLIEAKSIKATNVIIRQLFYPFKQWQTVSKKNVQTLFFEKNHAENTYLIWQFEFQDPNQYNSITLKRSRKYLIK